MDLILLLFLVAVVITMFHVLKSLQDAKISRISPEELKGKWSRNPFNKKRKKSE